MTDEWAVERSAAAKQDLIDIRAIALRGHLLLYRVFAEQRRIQIVRIVDGRRDLPRLDLRR